jgi:hypothetical protein
MRLSNPGRWLFRFLACWLSTDADPKKTLIISTGLFASLNQFKFAIFYYGT